jgi:hypothetical protein
VQVPTLDIAEIAQRIPKCCAVPVTTVEGSGLLAEVADPRDLIWLLRACRERPGCRAAEQDDEAAPFQLIVFRQVAARRLAAYRRSVTKSGLVQCRISVGLPSVVGQKQRPSQPRHVSFHRLRTLVHASIRWSSRPNLLSLRDE